jgi:POT family proton-dependent oligopeptide transporter
MQPSTQGSVGFAGHPSGLSTLFFTEFWERFSYYGMRAFLVYYMTAAMAAGGLGWSAEHATMVYGLYTASVYLMSIPGGFVADRLLGTQRSVVMGGVVIALGHFCLAFLSIPSFYAGLVLVVLGTGLLKPNASALVGQLYAPDDPRRDAGYSLYYMGINLGALVAPFVCSTLAEKVGWHLGFAAAGIGMTAGLAWFLMFRNRIGGAGAAAERPLPPRRGWSLLLAALLAGVAVMYVLWDYQLFVILAATVALFVWMAAKAESAVERTRVGAIALLFVFSALFWAGFEQAGSSLSLFARDFTDLRALSFQFPAGLFQAVNPLWTVLLAPVLVWVWARLGSREPSSPAKFAIGLMCVGASFIIMAMAALQSGPEHLRVSPAWLFATYVLHSAGELCLSPVGMSTVSKLAPARLAGLMMGVWFLSLSLGNYLGGRIAGYFELLPLPKLFGAVAATTLASALLLLILTPWIKKLMSGVR